MEFHILTFCKILILICLDSSRVIECKQTDTLMPIVQKANISSVYNSEVNASMEYIYQFTHSQKVSVWMYLLTSFHISSRFYQIESLQVEYSVS